MARGWAPPGCCNTVPQTRGLINHNVFLAALEARSQHRQVLLRAPARLHSCIPLASSYEGVNPIPEDATLKTSSPPEEHTSSYHHTRKSVST